MQNAAFKDNVIMQFRVRFLGSEGEVFAAALRIIAVASGDGFHQRGFAGAIFAYEKCDRRAERQSFQVPDGWNAKWVAIETGDLVAFQPHGLEKCFRNDRHFCI
jgi:hypothetical protein